MKKNSLRKDSTFKSRRSFSTGVKLASFFFCIFFALNLTAHPVDSVLTKRVAQNFYKSRVSNVNSIRTIEPQLVYTGQMEVSGTRQLIDCYYIYNIGNGFVDRKSVV